MLNIKYDSPNNKITTLDKVYPGGIFILVDKVHMSNNHKEHPYLKLVDRYSTTYLNAARIDTGYQCELPADQLVVIISATLTIH